MEVGRLQPGVFSDKRLSLAGRGNSTTLIIAGIVYGDLHKQASTSASCWFSAPTGMFGVKVSWWSSEVAQWGGWLSQKDITAT